MEFIDGPPIDRLVLVSLEAVMDAGALLSWALEHEVFKDKLFARPGQLPVDLEVVALEVISALSRGVILDLELDEEEDDDADGSGCQAGEWEELCETGGAVQAGGVVGRAGPCPCCCHRVPEIRQEADAGNGSGGEAA